jgi:hypothetical protein
MILPFVKILLLLLFKIYKIYTNTVVVILKLLAALYSGFTINSGQLETCLLLLRLLPQGPFNFNSVKVHYVHRFWCCCLLLSPFSMCRTGGLQDLSLRG